ncbi:hypothetical protein NDK47_15225 [Brevibacillus ruminantium]|uniref:Uncharacterized protein n=1 Tax=Brevibacillus ruminantium TaxID=2950604 RepID=A0ABY4WC85_9BACL|nr:hypothetical protein [Brevibacillus ruminantium]USG63527.1 hypothetical protein NDK47_15225 [Brevibacillus ruminantium]
MATKKWRNPYAPIPSKKLSDQSTDVSLAVTPKKVVQAVDLRTSVSKMRSNIKGISSTIRQVEETMDTLYGAMEMFDTFGKRKNAPENQGDKQTAKKQLSENRLAAEEVGEDMENSGASNPLGNIDIGQILGLLQSPLVQSLLTSTTNAVTKRKKEG